MCKFYDTNIVKLFYKKQDFLHIFLRNFDLALIFFYIALFYSMLRLKIIFLKTLNFLSDKNKTPMMDNFTPRSSLMIAPGGV